MLGLLGDPPQARLTSRCEPLVQPMVKRGVRIAASNSAGIAGGGGRARVTGGRSGRGRSARSPPHRGRRVEHGPRRRRPGQGWPARAGPQDRVASLTRAAGGVGAAGWPRQRPVRGRVQGPGRGAHRARPFRALLPGEGRTAYRVCRPGRRLCSGCWSGAPEVSPGVAGCCVLAARVCDGAVGGRRHGAVGICSAPGLVAADSPALRAFPCAVRRSHGYGRCSGATSRDPQGKIECSTSPSCCRWVADWSCHRSRGSSSPDTRTE